MSLKAKLEHLVAGQVPGYIREEFPGFVTFLEAYYRFLESSGQPQALLNSASDWIDVDTTLDAFVSQMREQYAWDISQQALLQNRQLIKYISQYYSTKGSESATELFFRLMYNEAVRVQYPGAFILRASDGRWEQRRTIKMDSEGYGQNSYDLANKRITLRYYRYVPGTGNQAVTVDTDCLAVTGTNDRHIFEMDVATTAEQITPLLAAETNLGKLLPDGSRDLNVEVLVQGVAYGTLSRQIIDYEIVSPGAKFVVGETYIIDEQGAGGAYFQEDYTEYPDGPEMYAGNDLNNRAIIRVTETGKSKNTYFAQTYTDPTYNGTSSDGELRALKILTAGYRFISPEFRAIIAPDRGGSVYAEVNFFTGFVKVFPGKFRSPAGFVSDICKMQDNEYHQTYSYVVQTRISSEGWMDQYKKSAHPIGTRVFSELLLEGAVDYSYDVSEQIVSIPEAP